MTGSFDAVRGWAGSGLTHACLDHYRGLLAAGVAPSRVLWIVRAQPKAQQMLAQIQAMYPVLVGPVRVSTFLSLVSRSLADHWLAVRQTVPELPATFAPEVLSKDLTQYLLAQSCTLCPQHALVFGSAGLKPYRVWDELSSMAYVAGANGVWKVGDRLSKAWPDPKDQNRCQLLAQTGCCLERLRTEALKLGCLDYGTQITLFQQAILPLDAFWQDFDYVIVDQVEDSPAVALDFYQQCHQRIRGLFVALTQGGGESFTGVPRQVEAWIAQKANVTILTGYHKGSAQFVQLGAQMARALNPSFRPTVPKTTLKPQVRLLQGQTYLEAADQLVQAIHDLLATGVAPGAIAVLVPRTNPALSLRLTERLGSVVYPIEQFPALVKYPLIRGLLTLIELTHPGLGTFVGVAELRLMLEIILDLDPVRAELLAMDVLDPVNGKLLGAAMVRFPERVGFAKLKRYQSVLTWIQAQSQESLPLDHFLRKAFADLLATVLMRPEDQALVQSLTAAAQQFRQAFPHLELRNFLEMIRSGQSPSPSVFEPDLSERLVLCTPIAYLNRGLSSAYQVWFDISSDRWMRPIWQTLYNHRVLTPEWNGLPFTLEEDRAQSSDRMARTLFNLSCRITQELWLVRAMFNGRGEENTGSLDRVILSS